MTSLLRLLLIAIVWSGCSSYKQNIMFNVKEDYDINRSSFINAGGNYLIRINDVLELKVYPNDGERILDPASIPGEARVNNNSQGISHLYIVHHNGYVKFPLIDSIKMAGYTLLEAQAVLEKEFSRFYKEPFVELNYSNKRVVVLGATEGQVIPLTNQNMRLTEILALAKGISNEGKARNIRILRGNDVFVADLSTFEGYQKDNIIIQPDDIVYVEPVRKPISEAFRDYGPLLSVATSLTTIVILIINLNTN